MSAHKASSGRGTYLIDLRFKQIGRIRVASGTDDVDVFNAIVSALKVLYRNGELTTLVMVREKKIAPLEIYAAFKRSELDRLPKVEDFRSLKKASDDWLAHFDAAPQTIRDYRNNIAQLLKLNPKATLAGLPELLEEYRRKCLKQGKRVAFARCRSALMAFVRDTIGRSSRLYGEVSDVRPLKRAVKPPKPRLSVDFVRDVREALGDNGTMWWSMCMTGMIPKEYFIDGFRVEKGAVRIFGEKRTGRQRRVPLVYKPVQPRITPAGFKTALQRVELKVTPKQARDFYAQLLEEAKIPRTRRRMYLGHGGKDITDVYEEYEIASRLREDAERIKEVLGKEARAGMQIVR